MTIPEEIEQLKIQLPHTTNEHDEAELILELLKKYASISSNDSQPYIDRLLQLAEKTNTPDYKAWGFHYFAMLKRSQSEFAASMDLSNQALSLFEQTKNKKGIAASYSNIGRVYEMQGNYQLPLKYYSDSLKLSEETGDKQGIATTYNNIGMVYESQGNYPESLKNYFTSLKFSEEIGDKQGIATTYNNIGANYGYQGSYPEALKFFSAYLKLKEEIGGKWGTAVAYENIGIIYYRQGNDPAIRRAERSRLFRQALKNYFHALKLKKEIGDKLGLAASYNNTGLIYESQAGFTDTGRDERARLLGWALKKHFAALKLRGKIGDKQGLSISHNNIGNVYYALGNDPEASPAERAQFFDKALKELLHALQLAEEISYKESVKECTLSLSNIYKATRDFENFAKYYQRYHEVEKELLGQQTQKQLAYLSFQHNFEQKEKELEIEQLRNVELKKEKDRSESLLLNILPAEVAEELKEKGTAAAKHFDQVTVMFTDFKGFTTISERLTPQQLVDELHACFSAFDAICGKYNIEKIKTVGDAYLAVSGLPLSNPNHASDVINAVIEIREFIKERRKLLGENTFTIRIGVHSGSVVAGIVGVKKFAYDIWGDTVNTAARMEQNSEAGKINISQTTYELVKDKFSCKYRGEIDAKNKGKLKMYFVVE